MRAFHCYALLLLPVLFSCSQNQSPPGTQNNSLPVVEKVDIQPLAEHVKRLTRQLDFIGSPLPSASLQALNKAYQIDNDSSVRKEIQAILDPFCLAGVNINPESRVKSQLGPALPVLFEKESKRFLVKIINEAGVTAPLRVDYTGAPQMQMEHHRQGMEMPSKEDPLFHVKTYLPQGTWYHTPSIPPLSGLEINYAIVDIYCRDVGKREITFAFDVGQGTQDLGFRSELPILFTVEPTYPLTFDQVTDESGEDVMTSFVIRDEDGKIFPAQSSRVPPDFWFQPQVYRTSGQEIRLPNGKYEVFVSRGPEYETQVKEVVIDGGPEKIDVTMERWIDPSEFGYWSGDHHIHAAGCAHYTIPSEGVLPKDMLQHILGEDLKVGSVLTWGPGFDYQKQFFTGDTDEKSIYPYTMRYDVEVSGFGSHQSGHLVLLRLQEQIYPGGESYEHWPTLGLNTLKWAQKQGAVCGPAHSGYGINMNSEELPFYEVPPYNSIGANEYVVDVTHMVDGPDGTSVPAVDFISTGDTWPVAELNMWYHTLNAGFRTRISGETDFPCITGSRVGIWRSYVRLEGDLNYDAWCEGISKGTNYVSDGFSHLIDFSINGQKSGDQNGTIPLDRQGKVKVKVSAAAHLKNNHEHFTNLYITEGGDFGSKPWSITRAATDNKVKVELIVNGTPVDSKMIDINADLKELEFDLDITESSWVATRIFPSSHTNPIWVTVGNKPVRASKKSVEWLIRGVEQCWQSKKQFYDEDEMADAIAAYDHARKTYQKILSETVAI
ncbi:MAG: CehA/McbA family metallohydrolase [Bacteroidetes bacterium]|nr:CehA/McbA family metallohydrolase [Bacteroidota bacterium]MDA1119364.1 CehA/McbA family metallohydrolase [Bacteroidota bacterium]